MDSVTPSWARCYTSESTVVNEEGIAMKMTIAASA